ncbi:MAG: hypothetical protein HYU66_16770 [Armatimonadetes bacterium]|nr:hypothetical protein [Armatimonadota bacterium]
MRARLLVLGLVLLVAAGYLRPETVRRDHPGGAVPPGVALATVALGGMNGLIVDFLWLRASEQQDQGRYFEMAETARWVSALEPHLGRMYDFQAWNMAYNISVQFSASPDRWRWIEQGLRLLVEDGLRTNPDDAEVCRSIAFILTGKIADNLDRSHYDYKRYWADEWSWILGGARPDFAALAQAPEETALCADPQVAALLEAARRLNVDLLEDAYRLTRPGAQPPAPVAALLAEATHTQALGRILLFARRQRLTQHWRMDPARMARVDAGYGPFDWRAAQPHAIYWALLAKDKERDPKRALNVERLLYQTLWSAFQSGRLVYVPGSALIFPTPDLNLIPRVEQEYARALAAFPKDESLKESYQTFEQDAIAALYVFHRETEARKRYADLARKHPEKPEYRLPFEAYALKSIAQLAQGDQKEVINVVHGLLIQKWQWYAVRDDDQEAGTAALARLVYDRYELDVGSGNAASLPPFAALDRSALTSLCTDTEHFSPALGALIERRLSEEHR